MQVAAAMKILPLYNTIGRRQTDGRCLCRHTGCRRLRRRTVRHDHRGRFRQRRHRRGGRCRLRHKWCRCRFG